MSDKEFTDEEIITGLECCISTTTNEACVGCPFNKQKLCDKDQWALERYALDLINRQKSEIERLKSANDEKFRQWDMLAEKSKQHYADLYEEAKDILKVEAYKEFAERIKLSIKANIVETLCNDVKGVYNAMYVLDDIDTILKEMVGEE